jgi:hypothetical protein
VDSALANHRWATVWFSPRATVRRAVDSGRRGDPALVSAVWGLSISVFILAQQSKTLPPGMKPSIVAFGALAGTLVMTATIYMNGALRAWGGKKMGGKGTVSQLSEAIALSQIPFVSWFVLGAAIAIWLRFTYGDRLPVGHVQPAPLWSYLFLGFGAGLLVWSVVLRKYCILEVQGFSAAQGRRAFWIGMNRYLLLLIAVATVLVGASFAVGLFRG